MWERVNNYRKKVLVCVVIQSFGQIFSNVIHLFSSPGVNGWASCPNGTDTSCFWDSYAYHNSKQIVLNVSVQNLKKEITLSKNVTFYRDEICKYSVISSLLIKNQFEE